MSDPAPAVVDGPRPWWRSLLGLNGLGILLLVGSCLWSMARVASIHHELNDSSVTTLRVAHWQLEAGYREAMQAIITDYERLHPNVKVVQMAVTEKVYGTWLNVNLIADKAPDVVEMGMSRLATTGDGIAKYFVPLSREMQLPNPWNAPQYLDELETTDPALRERLSTAPWRETLVDGMRGGYRPELQDYFAVPTAFATQRLLYNKAMFRAATGSDQPPRTLSELYAIADKLRAQAKTEGRTIDPIAGTRYHRSVFLSKYLAPFSASFQRAVDWNVDGEVTPMETWAAIQNGTMDLRKPQIRAYYETMRRICQLYNPNFAAMERDQAISAFAQGQSAMIASGIWEVSSLFRAAKDFEIGICDFPLPDPAIVGDPLVYPGNEASEAGQGGYAITKGTQHMDLALDFLHFISSHKWNQKLNRLNGWLPVTVGTTPDPRLLPFMPNPYGVARVYNPIQGGSLETLMGGQFEKFLGSEIDYEAFASATETTARDPRIGIDPIWHDQIESTLDQIRASDKTLLVQNYRLLLGVAGADAAARARETVSEQVSLTNASLVSLMYQRLNQRSLPEEP